MEITLLCDMYSTSTLRTVLVRFYCILHISTVRLHIHAASSLIQETKAYEETLPVRNESSLPDKLRWYVYITTLSASVIQLAQAVF